MPLFPFFSGRAPYEVFGPYGGISTTLVLPDGFDKEKDKCPLVILMHGFISKKELYPIPAIAAALAKAGIASLRFDFDAHGKSEGKFIDMTITSEIADARAVLAYARTLPFVSEIALLGHSQGGVIAGMLAGELEDLPERPKCLVLLAPAAVLKDDALAGRCMHARYDAANPPAYVNVLFHKLGRRFILEAQQLPIYETSSRYTGKVCIIQGRNDKIVPVSYAEKYHQSYQDSELYLYEDEGHFLNGNKARLTDRVVTFFKENLAK